VPLTGISNIDSAVSSVPWVVSTPTTGNIKYYASLTGGAGNAPLLPGNYTVSSTVTCVGQ
jgi:hypothetical protein